MESASIERSSGILVSSASPVQETKAVGMHQGDGVGRRGSGTPGWSRPRRCSRGPRTSRAGRPTGSSRRPARPAPARRREKLKITPPCPSGEIRRVVLLGGRAGERLEPVGVVRGAVLDRPVLHRGGHHVGHGVIEGLALIDGPDQALEDVLGEPLPHHRAREDVAAVDRVHGFELAARRCWGGHRGKPSGKGLRAGARTGGGKITKGPLETRRERGGGDRWSPPPVSPGPPAYCSRLADRRRRRLASAALTALATLGFR